MGIKSFLKKRSTELMQDPKVTKLMQDERVMKVAMQAFQLRGKVQEQVDQNVEKAAQSLGLVTKAEARELKRAIKKLETELKRQSDAAAKKKD